MAFLADFLAEHENGEFVGVEEQTWRVVEVFFHVHFLVVQKSGRAQFVEKSFLVFWLLIYGRKNP